MIVQCALFSVKNNYTLAVTVTCILQFQYQRTNTICEKNKQPCYFLFSTIELFPLLAHFSLLKYLLWENTAIIRWPQCKVTALHVMRTLFLHPRPRLFPPWFRRHVVRTMDNTIQCINHYPADKYHRETNNYSLDGDLFSG